MKLRLKLFLIIFCISSLITSSFYSTVKASYKPTAWVVQDNLLYSVASHTSYIHNSKLHVLLGATSTINNYHSVANINMSGVVYDWNYLSPNFPNNIFWHTQTYQPNKVYVLGGAINVPTYSISNIYLNLDPSSNNWQVLGSLPNKLAQGAALVNGDYMYYFGGFEQYGSGSNRVFHDEIFYNEINPDGTLGAWQATTPLPFKLHGHKVLQYEDYIYLIGGATENGTRLPNVYRTTANPDGSLNNWYTMPSLPVGLERPAVTIAENTIFVAGGNISGGKSDQIYYTELDENGNYTDWQQTELPYQVCCGTMEYYNDNLYLIGGVKPGGVYLNSIYKMELDKDLDLGVTYYLQTDPIWANNIYDYADKWSDFPYMNNYGCAVTSASMVLDYYGYYVEPGELNQWLIDSNSGYTRNGNLIWSGVTRYAKEHQENQNLLEYHPIPSPDEEVVKAVLNTKTPTITKVPGHFVVSKGYDPDNIFVNDPAGLETTLAGVQTRWGEMSRLDTFTPSNTDLSYIYFYIDEDIEIEISGGNSTADGLKGTEEPIDDPLDEETNNTAETLNYLMLPKPEDGEYLITLSTDNENETDYQFDYYFFNETGGVEKGIIYGYLNTSDSDDFILHYSDNPYFETEQLLTNLYELLELADLKDSHYNNVIQRLENAERQLEEGEIEAFNDMVTSLVSFFEDMNAKHFNEEYRVPIIEVLNSMLI